MKKVEVSIIGWGIYLIALGSAFILAPLKTVAMFGYTSTDDIWIRFIGILSIVLALFYIQIAINHVYPLYKWKIIGHLFGSVCMIIFLLQGIADGRIIGTIVIELLACMWTLFTLRSALKTSHV